MAVWGASAHAFDSSDSQRARALFDEAGELERRGQWGAAQERLREALGLRETPHLHYALGWALENDDRLVEAKAEYETAARLGREHASGEEAARLATARLAELDKTQPVIKVRVSGAARSNARVIIDGREVWRENGVATIPVDPGSHVIRVERDNDGAFEEIVYVGRGAVRAVNVEAGGHGAPRNPAQDRHGRLPSRPPLPPKKPAANEHGAPVLPWLLLSGGVVFVAGGGALLMSASADADRHEELQAKWCSLTACTTPSSARTESAEALGYRRSADEAADAATTKEVIGVVLGGAGLVAGTAGALLLLRGDERAESENARRSHGQRARAGAAPLPGGAMATAMFSF